MDRREISIFASGSFRLHRSTHYNQCIKCLIEDTSPKVQCDFNERCPMLTHQECLNVIPLLTFEGDDPNIVECKWRCEGCRNWSINKCSYQGLMALYAYKAAQNSHRSEEMEDDSLVEVKSSIRDMLKLVKIMYFFFTTISVVLMSLTVIRYMER